ncbi:MAG: hypothetical protein QOH61_92 [Chloroflexota bacterium]|jgi:glycosyltransferase involved in cell wall biosynthesis|nr:hypothetical protein [Chloroflexota bacterium]
MAHRLLAHQGWVPWHNPLFDRDWYRDRYSDVRLKGANPERHYRRHGFREGRDPNPWFSTAWYLETYADVADSAENPLDHYYLYGASEGRNPGPSFDTTWYLDQYPDVRASGMNPLLHYLEHGAREGRIRAPGARVVRSMPGPSADAAGWDSRLVLVVHDAHDHGAQQNALHMARTLFEHFHVRLDILLLGPGALRPSLGRYGTLHDLNGVDAATIDALLRQLRSDGVEAALVNTTVAGRLAPLLARAGFRVVTLVHELPGIIRDYGLEDVARDVVAFSDAVVFPTENARDRFATIGGELGSKARVKPQGLYKRPELPDDPVASRRSVMDDLGLAHAQPMVLAVGFADLRKGFDLFIEAYVRSKVAMPEAAFVWLGCENDALRQRYERGARRLGMDDTLRLLPRVPDVGRYYAAADLVLLPSREDPYPSVVLEALSHGRPVIAFDGATGATDLLRRGAGVVVPYLDVGAMSAAAVELLKDGPTRDRLGSTGRQIVADEYDWLDYLHALLELLGQPRARVSVVVPNYNYARYLPERLESIFRQSYPVREVIVPDDASTDDSLATLAELRSMRGWEMDVVPSESNSGSVFRQWLRGVERSKGELVWIAEADDVAHPGFLAALVPLFSDGDVALAYAQSSQIDAEGRRLANDYLNYVADVDPQKWRHSWKRGGRQEIVESLAIRNTIPNVSAVLFDRARLLDALRTHLDAITGFKIAGDYAVYFHMLKGDASVAFVSDTLNDHRRHDKGVTVGSFGPAVVEEIARMQEAIASEVAIPEETARRARGYLRELVQQFDLPDDFVDRLPSSRSRRDGIGAS